MRFNKDNFFRIISERQINGKTLAKLAGLSENCISKLRSGKTLTMTPITAGKLAKALNVDVMEICCLEKE